MGQIAKRFLCAFSKGDVAVNRRQEWSYALVVGYSRYVVDFGMEIHYKEDDEQRTEYGCRPHAF
jgi:hypothetical protein